MFTSLGSYNENGVTVQLYDVRFHTANNSIATELVDNEFAVALGSNLPKGIPADGAIYNNYCTSKTNGILWPMLAEKAYVQAASAGYVINSFTRIASPCSNSYENVDKGYPMWAISAISGTGHGESFSNLASIAISECNVGG